MGWTVVIRRSLGPSPTLGELFGSSPEVSAREHLACVDTAVGSFSLRRLVAVVCVFARQVLALAVATVL